MRRAPQKRRGTSVISVRTVCALAFAGCLAAASASAHHSFAAEFDETKPIKLSGKVIEMRWANPHAWIYLEVPDANGKPEKWALETGAANALFRRGWRKEDLPAGTALNIEGWLARNGTKTVNARSILFPDGRRLFAGSSNPNATEK
jgi:hypothetical protein